MRRPSKGWCFAEGLDLILSICLPKIPRRHHSGAPACQSLPKQKSLFMLLRHSSSLLFRSRGSSVVNTTFTCSSYRLWGAQSRLRSSCPTSKPLRLNTMSSTTTAPTTTTISAPELLRLFPDVNPTIIGSGQTSTSVGNDLEGYDEEQVRLMDEVCIVVDSDDKPIGSGSKKICQCRPSQWHWISLGSCLLDRPSNGKHREGITTSRLLCVPI